MKKINILIIDSEEEIRRILTDLIRDAEHLTVTGCEGAESVSKTRELLKSTNPDVLLLGINTAGAKQMQLFDLIRKEHPYLPIIVLTPHNLEGAEIALTTLKKGAVEYVIKHMNRTGPVHAREHFRTRLIPVIKAVPRLNRKILLSASDIESAIREIEHVLPDSHIHSENQLELLVIAGCLGGVPALYTLLSGIPGNLPVPIVIVQHMPEIYTQVFANDLSRITTHRVNEAENGMHLKPGQVYLAPGGFHTMARNFGDQKVISLHRGPKVKEFRPSIDVFLESARNLFGNKVLVVYLSGGGNDGIEGAKVIDIAGGRIILQNKSSSLLPDLPWKIEGLGIDEGRYPLQRLGHEITRRIINIDSFNMTYKRP